MALSKARFPAFRGALSIEPLLLILEWLADFAVVYLVAFWHVFSLLEWRRCSPQPALG
jgi:hypothetical protein